MWLNLGTEPPRHAFDRPTQAGAMGCSCARGTKFDDRFAGATGTAVRGAQQGAPAPARTPVAHAGSVPSAGVGIGVGGVGAGTLGLRAEVPGGVPRQRRSRNSRPRAQPGGIDWMATFDDRYNEALNERMLQEVLEQSKKAHLLTGLPREKYDCSHHGDLVECELCLEDYQEGEEVLRMPCMHFFHSKCVLPWMQKSYTCPVCNTDAAQAIQATL
eukprot:CAMPEP_0203971724 /NCGR_PEP_ID=MMETSP0359-20131031/98623_1 /ASSEMBLY_ACC=CAM_ASM_000338 /TAXON_ID=268821 /ORGANISM="Scrippsiella Hangoei, Strain SHTV-5" /LENGTH=214 /DNA_ID=CAMNT_0050909709 /DNA_START=5 /DNA_END=649 /DNA_ORIENTATION=+